MTVILFGVGSTIEQKNKNQRRNNILLLNIRNIFWEWTYSPLLEQTMQLTLYHTHDAAQIFRIIPRIEMVDVDD